MPKDTPSMAKNKIRRCLYAILDPHPSKAEVAKLWDFFESSCAYCGTRIDRQSRTGHVDHLVSTSVGGTNSIYNHVLACARCNGDEKREEHWSSFLARKVVDPEVAAVRRVRIESWQRQVPGADGGSAEAQLAAERIISEALAAFESAVSKMRELRKSDT